MFPPAFFKEFKRSDIGTTGELAERRATAMNVIEEFEKSYAAELAEKRDVPEFGPGDTLRVNVKVVEGTRERIQAYEGVCIARKNAGINSSFTVRKLSFGEGVERVFPLFGPRVDSIDVIRRGKVRRAKLYYLRGRTGKAARIAERTTGRARAKPEEVATAAEAFAIEEAQAKASEAPEAPEAKADEKPAKAKPKADEKSEEKAEAKKDDAGEG